MQTYLFLSGFKNVPVMQEEGLHLIDTTRRHEDKVEDREQTKLQRKCAIAHFPKGETAEKGCKNVQNDLVPHIVLHLLARPLL
jgi:hypothetical protein